MSKKTTDSPLILTLTATVSAADYERFTADHTGPADIADSFNARLNEVFGSGPEVLTTVRVKAVETTSTITPSTVHWVKDWATLAKSENAQRLANKARKAVKRAKKALVEYYGGNLGLEQYVEACYEGEATRILNGMIRHLQELENTLRYVTEEAPYDPDTFCTESSDSVHHVSDGSCDSCGRKNFN